MESARTVEKAGETTRRKRKISLALVASVHAIGQCQEDKNQRERTTVTWIEQRDERKMKARPTLTDTSKKCLQRGGKLSLTDMN